MEVERVLHMVEGTGETSYASNSAPQKSGVAQLKHLIEEAILELCSETFIDSMSIADLGCSSGPNTLWLVSEIINIIDSQRRLLGRRSPQYLIYLNDLESNDFNTVFKTLLPPFYEKLKIEKGEEFGPCFVAAMPGSFYGRLFLDKSLHFVHSSYSVHWLSQVPKGLEDELGNPLNKGNVYIAETSPPSVYEAYFKQFQMDFSIFLRSRSAETVGGGRMVLSLVGRKSGRKEYSYCWSPLGKALQISVSQGFVKESRVDKFNLPLYHPSVEELRDVIAVEGSFHLTHIESHELQTVTYKNDRGETNEADTDMLVKNSRATVGPLLAAHLGEAAIDNIFEILRETSQKWWHEEQDRLLNIGISLTRRKHCG